MYGITSCNLMGNIGRRPELAKTKGGMSVCSVSIAITQLRGKEKHTSWTRVMLYADQAELVGKLGEEGSRLYVWGARYYVDETEKGDRIKRVHTFVCDPKRAEIRLEDKDEQSSD